jgi:hypothetical protein
VSFEKGEAWIKYDDKKVTVARLREVINGTGFKAVEEKKSAKDASNNGKQNFKGQSTGGRQKMDQNFSTDLKKLRASFNQDKGKVRLLLLLSPT